MHKAVQEVEERHVYQKILTGRDKYRKEGFTGGDKNRNKNGIR